MLALAWPWDSGARAPDAKLSNRLASSVCAGIGGHAGSAAIQSLHLAYRPLRGAAAQARTWRPAQLGDGRLVLFHGYFDNIAAIAQQLGVSPQDPAMVYGLAVDRWGDDGDLKIVGDYCAVIADPGRFRLRLARSPLRAPPLYYFHSEKLAAVASVPRALFAAGVEPKLNEAHVADSAMYNFTDEETSWYWDIIQVPVGCAVELERDQPRRLRKYYNLVDLPFHKEMSDEQAIARAGELLDEGVRACSAGFSKPGSTVSGGLDSPQVAVRAAKALPPGQRLPTFTFHPEPGFDGRAPRWMMGNERPFVESLAAMHPELAAAAEKHELDRRLNKSTWRSGI